MGPVPSMVGRPIPIPLVELSEMKESIFWRAMAVVAVLGIFYVGHGLHQQTASPLSFDIATPVQAQGGAGITYNTQDSSVIMATSSNDGKTVHVFSRRPTNLKPVYLGSATAD